MEDHTPNFVKCKGHRHETEATDERERHIIKVNSYADAAAGRANQHHALGKDQAKVWEADYAAYLAFLRGAARILDEWEDTLVHFGTLVRPKASLRPPPKAIPPAERHEWRCGGKRWACLKCHRQTSSRQSQLGRGRCGGEASGVRKVAAAGFNHDLCSFTLATGPEVLLCVKCGGKC